MEYEPYDFTWDWAAFFRENGEKLFSKYRGHPCTYLEIGTYEGNSLCWMCDNILTHPEARAVSVDMKIQDKGWKNLQRHIDRMGSRLQIMEGDSKVIVPRLNEKFDMIYIDGDHSSKGCLFDSVAVWQNARGIVLWDDYRKFEHHHHVWQGVKSFFECVPKREYKIVCDNYQFGVERLNNQ